MIATLMAAALVAAPAQDTAYSAQGVDYRIEARLDEGTGVLTGRARLRYTNRSRATLDTLYVHQHLNAFRPNSAWARRELEYGVRRFQDLGPNDHAFERFTGVTVDGRAVTPAYPGAPDSTVAAFPLADPLAPGESAVVVMDWQARLSTLPRRQGRRGRHYDFAQWYPRIAPYDRFGWQYQPLLPQGEFYGEFGRYDVTLDVAADQVIGSTGVAVEGNPGYAVTEFEKGFYQVRPAESLGSLAGEAGEGRKRVRFVADSVHHFAWAADPTFVHESVTRTSLQDTGEQRGLPSIHVLYPPADTSWRQVAARHTYDALTWMQGLFGPYPWPQLTNLRRLEQGGTEFPMLVMNGSANEGLIVHEVAHQWLHGIFGNNEWRQGWMDEGFTSFVDAWYEEAKGDTAAWTSTMRGLERLTRVDSVQPVDLPSAQYVNPRIYTAMTYTKASAVFRMLREYLGEDVFRRVLREYYREFRLRHVTGEDFQRVAERVSGQDLDWFFGQWITRTDWLDYGVASASTRPAGGGRWRTRVEVLRMGPAWMPVDVQVGGVTRRLTGRERRQVVEIVTPSRPTQVLVDPRWVLIDPDRANNAFTLP